MNTESRLGTLSPVTEGELRALAESVREVPTFAFVSRLGDFALRSHHPERCAVSPLRSDLLLDARCYLTRDTLSGFAVRTDGTLQGLFSFVRGRGNSLLKHARDHGAARLECYAFAPLIALFRRHGFEVVARYPFDPSLVEPYRNLRFRPDYVAMEYREVPLRLASGVTP